MRIEKISDKPDRAGRYYVTLDGGETLRLYRQTVADFGLYPGLELTEEALDGLRQAMGAMSAKMRAVRIVTAGSVSRLDLQQRLIRKGENPEDARQAVSWMEQMQLVDDRETARQVVAHCIRRGYGVQRAKQVLYEKKIPKAFWQEALENYPDQMEGIVSYLRTHITDARDLKQVKRAVDALLRRGHSYSHIRRALSQMDVETEDFQEEI